LNRRSIALKKKLAENNISEHGIKCTDWKISLLGIKNTAEAKYTNFHPQKFLHFKDQLFIYSKLTRAPVLGEYPTEKRIKLQQNLAIPALPKTQLKKPSVWSLDLVHVDCLSNIGGQLHVP
jgi:hypothetical protein